MTMTTRQPSHQLLLQRRRRLSSLLLRWKLCPVGSLFSTTTAVASNTNLGQIRKQQQQQPQQQQRQQRLQHPIRRFTVTTTTTTSSSTGYQSIGSFHSENVEYLMAQTDEDYIPPSLPFHDDYLDRQATTIAATTSYNNNKNNSNVDSDDFMLDRTHWTFLNHGAFGAALRVGYHRAQAWRLHLEQQPLRYFDRDLLPHLVYSTRRLAKFMNAPSSILATNSNNDNNNNNNNNTPVLLPSMDNPNGLALLPNVTSGLCAILRNHAQLYPHANIILWDTTYGSVKKMANTFYHSSPSSSSSSSRIIEIPLLSNYLSRLQKVPPATTAAAANGQGADDRAEQVIIDALLETILDQSLTSSSQHRHGLPPPHSLLILDHTTSNTAINMPLLKLARAAKQIDPTMIVVVDGAHGLLAQHVDLQQLTTAKNLTLHDYHHDTTTTITAASASPAAAAAVATASAIDIYLSNGHKWLSCPRGVAVVYASSYHIRESLLRVPSVVSHGIDDGYLSRFLWDGCRDYAAALAVPAVLDYWNQQYQFPPPQQQYYHHEQQQQQQQQIQHEQSQPCSQQPSFSSLHLQLRHGLLAGMTCLIQTWYGDSSNSNNSNNRDIPPPSEWHLHDFTLVPMSLCGPTMALVRLPLERMMKMTTATTSTTVGHSTTSSSLSSLTTTPLLFTSTHAKQIQDYLYHHHRIEVPIKCVNGRLYVRVSYHIYNTTDDFKRLAQRLLQFPMHTLL